MTILKVLRVGLVAALAAVCGACYADSYSFAAYWPDQPYFNHPCGVAVDSAGNIYVADTGNCRIQKLDPNGNFVMKFGSKGSSFGQMLFPEGVAVSDTGYIYVMDTGNSRLQRWTSGGTYSTAIGSRGSGVGQFDWPLGISIDDDRDLIFVADTGQFRDPSKGHRIQVFDFNLQYKGETGYWNEWGGNDAYAMCADVVVKPGTGIIFATDCYGDAIQKYDTTVDGSGNVTFTFLKRQGVYNNMYPRGLGYNPVTNQVIMASPNYQRVERYDDNLNDVGHITDGGGVSRKPYGFAWPKDVACDSAGNIYVADTFNCRISKFTATGTPLAQYGGRASGVNGKFDRPSGICYEPQTDQVFVVDTYNNRIQKFTRDGVYAGAFGNEGSGPGQFRHPQGICAAASALLFVADSENHRIQVFNASGAYIRQFGSYGSGDGQLADPGGVAVNDALGRVYVADTFNHRIAMFTTTGSWVGSFGRKGSGNGQFVEPWGVAVGPDGTVYVADTGNNRCQRFDPDGNVIGKFGSFGISNGQFCWPRAITVDPNGDVLVADTFNDRFQKFSSIGVFKSRWAGPGSDAGFLRCPAGICTDADGNVYIAERQNFRISKFAFSP